MVENKTNTYWTSEGKKMALDWPNTT